MSKFNKEGVVYTYIFGTLICVVFAAVLSFTSQTLDPQIKKNKEIERKSFILKAALGDKVVKNIAKEDIGKYYDNRVTSTVVNYKGETINNAKAETINLRKEYKKDLNIRQLPVYTIKENGTFTSIVIPIYGAGLWDDIWGYMSLSKDMNTIKGIVFDHKGETPGLGAVITETSLQNTFIDKTIFEKNELTSVKMLKGTGNTLNKHQVDGISGATVTCNGVNDMLEVYLKLYKPYLINNKK